MSVIRAEYNILPRFVSNMLAENFLYSVRLIESAAKRLKISFALIAHRLVLRSLDAVFISFQFFLIGIDRQYILRRIEYPADDRLAERHFTRNISLKQFVRHIPLIIQITDIRRGQTEDGNVGISR